MKAFQLKIMIKNSKPPIWRRAIVPAGITFSQLSMILNEIMGWCGYHLFEFEFYHLELCIAEQAEEFEPGYGPFDHLEASTTFIREYLEENDWFTYTYDLGDDWQHRVTVEKIIEDYAFDYPQVIKYKGDCPVEDCGGIYGYYDCLEIISDSNHPEYEEMLEWMQEQGYPREYDPDEVNRTLRERFFYRWGKGEKRCQSDIYEEHFSGKAGLNATKRDKNKDISVNRSGRHLMQEALQRLMEQIECEERRRELVPETSLKNIYEDYDKDDIVEIAEAKGLKNLSRCRKETVLEKLTAYMLRPEVMRPYFLCLQDDELEEFEKAAKAKGFYEPEEPERLMFLYEAGYIGMLPDGRVMVPEEVRTAYQSFQDQEFEENRKKNSYLLCCLGVAGILYGIAPMSVLRKLIARNPAVQMTEEEIRTAVAQLPPEIGAYVIVGNTIYHKSLYPDDRGLRSAQGDKEFYIPTLEEIWKLGTRGCLFDSAEAIKLKRFLTKNTDADQDEADFICEMIQKEIATDCSMQDIYQIFEDMEVDLKDDCRVNKLTALVNDLWNNTRMLLNRGFTPNELSARERRPLLPLPEKSNVIEFRQDKKQKIYPNDPCPCGSGKKYKNCCKNKDCKPQ